MMMIMMKIPHFVCSFDKLRAVSSKSNNNMFEDNTRGKRLITQKVSFADGHLRLNLVPSPVESKLKINNTVARVGPELYRNSRSRNHRLQLANWDRRTTLVSSDWSTKNIFIQNKCMNS